MKKLILAIALLLIACSSFAQSLEFEIKPYVVRKTVITNDTTFVIRTDTCNKISLSIARGRDSVGVIYSLFRKDGSEYENGAKNVPLSVLGILDAEIVSIPAINTLFAFWFIEAIQQL